MVDAIKETARLGKKPGELRKPDEVKKMIMEATDEIISYSLGTQILRPFFKVTTLKLFFLISLIK